MSKKIFCMLVFAVFASLSAVNLFAKEDPYDTIARELSDASNLLTQHKVAIMPFAYTDKRKSDGGIIIAERLTTRIVKLKKLQVIERELLEKVVQELHLESSGIADVETTKQLGKVLGVDAIITGTLLDVEDGQVEINARMIKTETAEVIATAVAEIKKIWSDVSTTQPQIQQGQPVYQQPAYSQPAYQQPSASYRKPGGGFVDMFIGSSGGLMNLSFENTVYPIDEVDLSFDVNGSGFLENTYTFRKISFEKLETNSASRPIGIRFGGFGKTFGADFEISYVSRQLKKQDTIMTLNDAKTSSFQFYNDGYINVGILTLLSGDLLMRLSDKVIQPYLGMGLGLTLNKVTSPWIYQYHGSVYEKPLSQVTPGFLFRIPIGMRIMIGEKTSIFGEYRYAFNTCSIDRGIKSEVDTISISMNQILFGLGFGF
ncbi:MAG: FlgO family outer membrane protein [Elusimicrobia bacterium]|nr:FlgO family outer membrane protein [Elusimicrobiota bacterium]